MTLIECVPNVSEGRRPEVVDEICAAITAVDGVHLLDRQSDATHNRSVLTFVGELGPDGSGAAAAAAFGVIAAAARLIDLNHHEGAHPRFGAADVVPFVPLAESDMESCVAAARALARRVASELSIPAYLYEDAARDPARRNLAAVRGNGFEELREEIGADPGRAPDEGESKVHPTAGAVAIGARFPLIAYNVNLESQDLELAMRIASEIRERDGGLPKLKAIGLALTKPAPGGGTAVDCVQVSMNLTDYRVTSPLDALAAVRTRAAAAGVEIRESEVVGLLPLDAAARLAAAALSAPALVREQVLEARILDATL
jgi:glutamate formiminotransferase